MKALLAWFGTVVGKVVGIFLALALIFLLFRWQWVIDKAKTAWWGQKTASGELHGKNADSALKVANRDSALGVAAEGELGALLATPEVLNSPVATRVGVASKKVIATKNKEIGSLRTVVAEKTKQVEDVKAAGEKPVPRITPYAYLGYSVSLTKRYGVPVVRAGVDYRLPLVSFISLNGEVSYEPPPAPKPGAPTDKAEVRATIGARISFR
jgi:hypothetical protein